MSIKILPPVPEPARGADATLQKTQAPRRSLAGLPTLVLILGIFLVPGCAQVEDDPSTDSTDSPPPESGQARSGSAGPERASVAHGLAAEPEKRPRWAEDGVLRLVSWNVEWLWDGLPPEDGDLDFPRKGRREAAQAHLRSVAEILHRIDADLVNLAEVEDARTLRALEEHLPEAGYEAHFVEGRDSATGQDMALLSRLPISTYGFDPVRGRSGKTRKGVSKHYVATLEAGDLRLGLVGLHLLARPERQNRIHPRQAQADALRQMVLGLAGQGRDVVVWGDFNDYDGAVPDRRGSRPITWVLSSIRQMRPDDPADDLGNALERLPASQRVTCRHGTAIDHILLSPRLEQRIRKVEILRGVEVSDHYPIVVDLGLD